MTAQDFKRTAAYFEKRAAKAGSAKRRQHLESVAQLYRRKAGDNREHASTMGIEAPSRRERLVEMFRSYAMKTGKLSDV